MIHTAFLLLSAALFGFLLLRRALREPSTGLCLALGPLQGLVFFLLQGSLFPHSDPLHAGYALLALGLALLAVPSPTSRAGLERLSWRPWGLALACGTGVVLLYTRAWQVAHPAPPDLPRVAHLMRSSRLLPDPQGWELAVARLTRTLHDPLVTVWVLDLLVQGCAFAGLFFLARRFRQPTLACLLLPVFAFLGMCVGPHVGQLDAFSGERGLAYATAVLVLYQLGRVLEWNPDLPGRPAAWLVAGLTLAGLSLCSRPLFALFVLASLALALLRRPHWRPWLGLGATLLVAGGGAALLGQPPPLPLWKANLLSLETVPPGLSSAYRVGLFAPLAGHPAQTGQLSLFSPDFLRLHWLPLYLAPLTLVWLARPSAREERPLPRSLGRALWLLGAGAYLAPGLVHNGRLMEWEFAAGWGLAGALGLVLGSVLAQPSQLEWTRARIGWTLRGGPASARWGLALLVALAALLPGEKALNDAVLDFQSQHRRLFPPALAWRLTRPELGFTADDAQAMLWMSPQVIAGERVLSNLGEDAALATLTGAVPAGWTREGRRDALWRAFVATGRTDLLRAAGIRWLYLDRGGLSASVLARLPESERSPAFGTRRVFALDPLPPALPGSPLRGSVELRLPADAAELRRDTRYPLQIRLSQTVKDRPLRVQVAGQPPLELRVTGDGVEHSLVTPQEEGEFQLRLSDGPTILRELPFRVDLWARLRRLQVRLELPKQLPAGRFQILRVGLLSPVNLRAREEFTLGWKLAGQESEAIPQPVELELTAGQERWFELHFLAPTQPGSYRIELVLKEKATGETLTLPGDLPPLSVI